MVVLGVAVVQVLVLAPVPVRVLELVPVLVLLQPHQASVQSGSSECAAG